MKSNRPTRLLPDPDLLAWFQRAVEWLRTEGEGE